MNLKPSQEFIEKFLGPLLVLAAGLIFSIWFLPLPYLKPASTEWIFKDSGSFVDGSGHAIQAMFFAQEPWSIPPGRLNTFGGPVGASLIMAAVSPVFAFPAKIAEHLGLIGKYWQFIGIQGAMGICLTALAVYWLCRELRASRLASATLALMSLPIPGLFVLAQFNESLAWQCLAIVPIILLLKDRGALVPAWPWVCICGVAVWLNTYFLGMILPFFFAHLVVGRAKYRQPLLSLTAELVAVLASIVVLHYVGGGFTAPVGLASPVVADMLSVDLMDFFHSLYDRQGYVYRGAVVLNLLAGGAVIAAWRFGKIRSVSQGGLILASATMIAGALLVFSTGPILHVGHYAIPWHWPSPVLNLMGLFRGVGRFAWPFIYLLLGFAALSLDALSSAANLNRAATFIIALFLIEGQFHEFMPDINRFREYSFQQTAGLREQNPRLDVAVRNSREIAFIPAFDDPGGAPWRQLSYYAIKYRIPIYTYNWLGRFDTTSAERITQLSIEEIVGCKLKYDKIYAINETHQKFLNGCGYKIDTLATYPHWTVVKILH